VRDAPPVVAVARESTNTGGRPAARETGRRAAAQLPTCGTRVCQHSVLALGKNNREPNRKNQNRGIRFSVRFLFLKNRIPSVNSVRFPVNRGNHFNTHSAQNQPSSKRPKLVGPIKNPISPYLLPAAPAPYPQSTPAPCPRNPAYTAAALRPPRSALAVPGRPAPTAQGATRIPGPLHRPLMSQLALRRPSISIPGHPSPAARINPAARRRPQLVVSQRPRSPLLLRPPSNLSHAEAPSRWPAVLSALLAAAVLRWRM
jgi:hypothetical protein